MKTKHPKQRRATLAKAVAAEPDIEKKLALAWLGVTAPERKDPATALACDFFEIRKWDVKQQPAAWVFRDAAEALRKYTLEAVMNWQPEAFEKLALAMRRAARFEFEPTWTRTEAERRKWIELLEAEKSGAPNIRKLAVQFCRDNYGSDEKADSVERHFRKLRKLLFPARRHPDSQRRKRP